MKLFNGMFREFQQTFGFGDTVNVHNILSMQRQPPHTTADIYGKRYVSRGNDIWGWEYWVQCDDKDYYQWVREENLSKVEI